MSGCGAETFLQQHEGFQWRPDSLAAVRAVRLYDRATGQATRAADLPLPAGEDHAEDGNKSSSKGSGVP